MRKGVGCWSFAVGKFHFGFNPRRWKTGFQTWRGINLCTLARGRTISFSGFQITYMTGDYDGA